MSDTESPAPKSGPLVGDLAGAGQLVNSEVAKKAYSDALSPAMKELGGLTEDTLKTFRLFTAPLQLLAAYQDRFKAFCERVREKVPDEQQCDAPPEIAKPVMEAFASTSDDSPLMSMFEELMAKAIDKRQSQKLSPEFPAIIQSLSPMEALLLADLKTREQHTDDLRDPAKHLIVSRLKANFDFAQFGGHEHHLTISQRLKERNLVFINDNVQIDSAAEYTELTIPEGFVLRRTTIRLTMFGRWFVTSCVSTK
ncbi:MAG: Abi-alpha family protein [Planctomycetota bacterium]|nr:Abi-alpha family protein [Planctomycetota bacterium]MDA0920903.1 Abi-alpha family protein [Planctomycetota bacterium]